MIYVCKNVILKNIMYVSKGFVEQTLLILLHLICLEAVRNLRPETVTNISLYAALRNRNQYAIIVVFDTEIVTNAQVFFILTPKS